MSAGALSRAEYPAPADLNLAIVAGSGSEPRRDDFRDELLSLIPQLRMFTRGLSRDRDSADDLAQETLAKAWRYRQAFQHGTNLKAWLFKIARNTFYGSYRRAWRETPLDQAAADAVPAPGPEQVWSLELSEALQGIRSLSDPLRQALLLVVADGCSYEEAARICHCPVGTAKSRVSRARRALTAILDGTRSTVDAPSGSCCA